MKNEGNLEELFRLLDKIVEEAKDREEPAWYGWPGMGVVVLQGHQARPGLVWVSCWPRAAREGLEAAVSVQQCHWA